MPAVWRWCYKQHWKFISLKPKMIFYNSDLPYFLPCFQLTQAHCKWEIKVLRLKFCTMVLVLMLSDVMVCQQSVHCGISACLFIPNTFLKVSSSSKHSHTNGVLPWPNIFSCVSSRFFAINGLPPFSLIRWLPKTVVNVFFMSSFLKHENNAAVVILMKSTQDYYDCVSLHFAWVADDAKCIVVTRVSVCLSLCLCLSVCGRMLTLLNYSTPMASRASSPLSRDKNEISKTHFNGPLVKCSESEVVSTSTGLVASVTWPDLRYPCSLAGKNSSATVTQHLDGNRLRATGIGPAYAPDRVSTILQQRP